MANVDLWYEMSAQERAELLMTSVQVFFAPSEVRRTYFKLTEDTVGKLPLDTYLPGPKFLVTQEGEDAAEEAFDLSNNPSRQKEREELYGYGRSVSVGDMVKVDDVAYVCMDCGWAVIG